MEANELRIGNWVNVNHGRPYDYQVSHVPKNNSDFNTLKWQSIPITEEWLLKFGFKNIDNEWTNLKCLEFGVIIVKDNIHHIWDGAFTDSPCLFVHQLQNLYFALTGNELQCVK